MRGPITEDAVELNDFHAPAADTAAVVTVAAVAREFWVLDSIHYGYDRAPGAARTLTVTIGGVTKHTEYIPADIDRAGPHEVIFDKGLYVGENNKNEALVVTLEADDGGASGSVNITYR
jgi:hypothetical protein